jgi:menaquinol-cytochrome c reductase cytochrome b/c subunit
MQIPDKTAFPADGEKTYTLVELVRGAPQTMVNKGPDHTVFAFPVVALLEILLALGLTVALLLMSLARNAPLEEFANPNTTTDPAKAPWYFMGLQEMLEHGHPTLMAVVLPTLIVLFVVAIPYLDNSREGSGRWFTSARGKRICLYTSIYALLVMPVYIVLDSTFPPRELLRGIAPDWLSQFLIPALLMGAMVSAPVLFLRRFRPTAREVMLALFTLLFVSALVFTITGFFFRGPGFHLYWPWDMPNGYSPLDNL